SSTTNWMPLGNGSMPSSSGGAFALNGNNPYFFGPKYSYGKDGEIYLKFSGCNSVPQRLFFVMRYQSGTPENNFKGIAMQLRINIDGSNRFGYTLYNNGTKVAEEGTSWANAMTFPGSSTNPVLKFVLRDDHLYLYINDEENEWTNVVKDWGGLSTLAGNFGIYVNSQNGNGQLALDNFRSELDYAYEVSISDELPSELTNITNISGSGTYNAGTNKITWPTTTRPIAPNEEISYTFDATVRDCASYINNYGVANVYGQEPIRVVNSVKCGSVQCPDPPTATPISGCVNEEITLTAEKTGSNTLIWYDSDQTTRLSSNKITKSTAGTYTYYVSQKGACESDKVKVTVTVNATDAPSVTNASYCKNQSNVTALSVSGTSITWYNDAKVELSGAPVPDVTEEGTTTYYVTDTENDCVSDFAQIDVVVGALAKPGVTSPVTYCQGETATELTATAMGTLKWYESATATTSVSSVVPSTETVTTKSYFVSQASDECESERAEIEVVVKAKPEATIASTADSYCGDASTVKLSLT
ncbi:MAG: hypothetical protein J6X43_01205, partial [Bacteroidales bacterium]|nr:hypothetical protein [Bacteroidales bacterium]